MSTPTLLAITGGIGGAKLGLGLAGILEPGELAFLVNTGDDFRHLGLHISPDIDTLVYTLAGVANPEAGWGRRHESWNFMQALAGLGGEDWFQLGDRDLAMHIERTRRLGEGQGLGEVTAALAGTLGVQHAVIPMSDDPVSTRVRTAQGWMAFQHYFVRERCVPAVESFEFQGAARARLPRQVSEWLASPQLGGVILCPSNPFVSIDPVLAVPGLREQLQACPAPVVAVSPVVRGQAIKGPTVKMMQELQVPASALWVASHYREFLDGFVLDAVDEALAPEVEALGLTPYATNTLMMSMEDRVQLARDCRAFIDRLAGARTR